MTLKVLISGGNGFVGRRLKTALHLSFPEWTIATPELETTPKTLGLDVTDAPNFTAWIENFQPQVVVHLAAIAAVTASVDDPRTAWKVNLGGTLNLVTALQRHAPKCYMLYVSSAEVYGASLGGELPTNEMALLQPVNPYAASKAAADILVRQAAYDGLSATIMRPFNHSGAGQSEAFVLPNFAMQIARIEAGLQAPVISVGNLDEERDFLDVDDVVTAYISAINARKKLVSGTVFNVASGKSRRIGDLLDVLLSLAQIEIKIHTDPSRLRASSIRRVVGDSRSLQMRLHWKPAIQFERTLTDILLDARRTLTL